MGRIDDGYQTLITLAAGALTLYEKSVKPPGLSAGGAINTTTMHNVRWRTFAGKQLITSTPSSLTCAYDPQVYADAVAQMGVNQLITVTLPNGDTYAFWGFIDEVEPNDHVEGEQPTMEVTIIPTNVNDSGDETAPVRTAAA